MKKILILVAVAAVVTGCASSKMSLQRATAATINGEYIASDITIESVNRSAMDVQWNAVTNDGKKYNCTADDMVRRPDCKERKL